MDVPEIDVDTLSAFWSAGAPVIDVRQPDEYLDGHVPGAILIPLAEVPDRLDEIPNDAPVYVICRSGGRSLTASSFLIEHGLDASNVVGGIMAWMAAGHPVATGAEAG